MSLLYRAIWEDSRQRLPDVGDTAALAWLWHKGLEIDELPDGETTEITSARVGDSRTDGPVELTCRRASVDGLRASRVRLIEDRSGTGERWTTTFTTIGASSEVGGRFWVDIERVSDDPFARPPFRAPRLVLDLIESGRRDGGDPRVGHVRLENQSVAIRSAALAGLVGNEERRIALAVFSHDEAQGRAITMRRAEAAHKRLAGVAVVFVLPPEEVAAFRDAVGDELGVWGGAARLYLPNRGPRGLQPERHRYVAGARMTRSVEAAADQFVALLSATVPATPPPSEYEIVRRALSGMSAGSGDSEELLAMALDETSGLSNENQQLRGEVSDRDDAIMLLQMEMEDLESELNRKSGEIAWYARSLAMPTGATELEGVDSLPAEVATIEKALELAARLEGVIIHPEAPRDIEKLDSTVNAGAWANGTWRALRALDAYASNDESIAGGVWEWCARTHSPWSWPATGKKLAMTESESVQNNQRLREKRMLPVDARVEPSGEILMLAHIKVAEGGGMLAPRIYFHDDTGGVTGKVHVGFVGPHEHMPNTRTN